MGSFRIATWGTWEKRDQLYVGNDRENDPFDESVEITRALLELEYAIESNLTVSAIFSHVWIKRKVPGANLKEDISGLGDTLLLFKWTVFDTGVPEEEQLEWLAKEARWRIRVDFGASLPTGKTRTPSLASAGTPVSLLQAGSGTVQPLLGVGVRADWGGLAATLDVQSRLPLYENDNDFQEGVSILTSLGLEVRPVGDLIFRIALETDYRKRDLQGGNRIQPGGGVRLAVHPTIVWSPIENLHVFGGVTLPIYRDAPDRILDTNLTVEFGATYVF
ncbi:MAG: hypothetical protein ACI97A_004008 [Planctomycetota bacterium]